MESLGQGGEDLAEVPAGDLHPAEERVGGGGRNDSAAATVRGTCKVLCSFAEPACQGFDLFVLITQHVGVGGH